MDFSDLLKREYALFEDLIVQKEIDWNENISPALQIVADKMLIQKAINNIVSNAILYSPRGSSIYMDAFSKNGAVVFQIENTGVHIPEAEIPKLFDAFYRMEQSRNRKTGGSWRIRVLKRTPILLNRCPFLLCRGAVFELGQMVQLWLSVCRSTMWVYWPFRA